MNDGLFAGTVQTEAEKRGTPMDAGRCSKCGGLVYTGGDLCSKCAGTDTKAFPRSATEAARYCTGCGHMIANDSAGFCSKCGQAISETDSASVAGRDASTSERIELRASGPSAPLKRSLGRSALRIFAGVVTALVAIVIIVWVFGGDDSSSESEQPKATSFAVADIKEALGDIDGIGTVNSVKITESEGGKRVEVTYSPGDQWDENSLIETSARVSVEGFRLLFDFSQVAAVSMCSQATFTDTYGKSSSKEAVEIEWRRATAAKVDFAGMADLAWTNPERVFNIASSYSIHPGLLRESKYTTTLAPLGP